MKGLIIFIIVLLVIAVVAFLLFSGSEEGPLEEKARTWVLENSPTYLFDGSDLVLEESRRLDVADCEGCYEFEYSFVSSNAGYGDRTGETLVELATPHTIVVAVENDEVTKAITDEKFDEMAGVLLEPEEPEPETETISLFYYNKEEDTDEEGNVMCSDDAVLPVDRTIPVSEITSTARRVAEVIELLLKGEITEEEAGLGFETEFPEPDFVLDSAELTDGVLTLTFPEVAGFTTGGSCRVGLLRAQIEKTALQFDEVEGVEIMPESIFQP